MEWDLRKPFPFVIAPPGINLRVARCVSRFAVAHFSRAGLPSPLFLTQGPCEATWLQFLDVQGVEICSLTLLCIASRPASPSENDERGLVSLV
jgi:hypothetical protein